MHSIRRKLGDRAQAQSLSYVLTGLSRRILDGSAESVLGRAVVFGLDPASSVRFGHFDYLKEDSDDEFKAVHPAEELQTTQLVEAVTLADKLACQDTVTLNKRQSAYRRNNAPAMREETKWGSWMKRQEGRKKEKFDTSYSPGKFFAQMDFSGGGTISENPESEHKNDYEAPPILDELGKGSSTGARLLGDRFDRRDNDARREMLHDRFDPNAGFDRLPSLNLGRQYDTGKRFDRTRPTIRRDRYAMAWSKPDFEPKRTADGSLDTRPVLEFDLGRTDAVRYLGGERYRSTTTSIADTPFPSASASDANTTISENGNGSGEQPVSDFIHGGQPLGAYSKRNRQGPGFRYMTSWNAVYEAFQNLDGENLAEDISQALFTLKHMQPPPPEHVLVEIADAAVKNAHQMMPISLTNVIHSCAKMKFMYPPLIEEWQKQLNDPRVLEACTDLDITSIVHSFGVLNRMANANRFKEQTAFKLEKGLDFSFIETLANEAVHPIRMENYNYSMLVNILYGLSLMKFNKPEILGKILMEITKDSVLPRMEIQNISAAIYAIGYSRFWAPALTTKLLKAAIGHLAEFPSHGIANMMWSLGNLRYSNFEVVHKIAEVAVEEQHLRNYAEQDLTSVLYGLAMSRYRDPAIIGALITEVMRPGRLTQMQDSSLTHLLSSFSSMKYINQHLFKAVLAELTNPRRIKKLKSMHLANALYALGACRYDDPSALQQLMDEVMDPERLLSFSDFDVASILHGAGGMRIQDEKFVSAIMTEAAKSNRMEGYSAQSLVNIINACSLLRYRDEDLLSSACQALSDQDRIRQVTPTAMSMATLALCRLQFYDSRFFSEYLREATTPERIRLLKPATLIDLMFGCLRADVVHFARFMEIIKLMREPQRMDTLLNFPFVRLISLSAILGLRDEAFLNAVKDEILKEERRNSLTHFERREVARSFERLGFYEDDLCNALNYGKRVKGQSVGILAPGGLREAEEGDKKKEQERKRDDSSLDWTGQMRPTFYTS